MADFSKFGDHSNEWTDYVQAYGTPPPLPISNVAPEKIQETTNRSREEAARRYMAQEGSTIHSEWTNLSNIFVLDLTSKVEIETIHICARDRYSIPIRIYKRKYSEVPTSTPELPIYVFYHGGGFMFGTLDTEDAACARIAVDMDIIVVSVCYRHTPQHPFPAAHNDALDSFNWVIANIEGFGGDLRNVVVGGISAGANLAVTVALAHIAGHVQTHERLRLGGLVLCIPWLVINEERFPFEDLSSREISSRAKCAEAPVVSGQVLRFFVDYMGNKVRERGGTDPDVGLTNPETLQKFPSTAIMVAGSDPLRDDGLLFAQRLQAVG